MSSHRFPYRLYLVTDEKLCLGRDLIEVTELAVKGGVDIVQIREKQLNTDDFLRKANKLKEMLDRYNVPLIVNDDLLVAKQCGAAGIHVGNSDESPNSIRKGWNDDALIGYSVEDIAHVNNESASYADYLGVSPVFATSTKTDTIIEWGLKGIAQIRSLTEKPLVAIGGINEKNAYDVIRAGADCLAVVSAICSAADPAKAAEYIRNEIERAIK